MPPYRDINISRFNGLWDRGQDDTVPKDHFIDCLNTTWDGDDITTRDGSAVDITHASAITRIHEFKMQGQASRLLVLSGTSIYDSTDMSSEISILMVYMTLNIAGFS